ncbi:EF-hand domain-containing protein [Streptomyces sp. ASQP_92]|uniref:EF-hand domain-containing protein n=1 Tax=unclassified Streptomyces TaxID=2593676 RepID=UPI0021C1D78A|nr:EF-hand domain-containing protein [Streptomyces sp. ASQP_92]MCT9091515.1 EF-hand domain-containing protein [Streptomyces sp. ASQP_92]
MADIEEARKAFAKLDVDGDGRVTASEYKTVMAQLGDFYVTETVAQAIIKAKDANGDGKLSFEEFWASLNK